MCARERALAAHSEQSHVKAIIISPPAITATSDSPLPAKLISPSFQVCHPPSLLPSPPWPTHFPGICRRLLSAFLCSSFSSMSCNSRKSQFSTCFLPFIPSQRLLCLTEMCLYPEYNSSCWTRTSSTETERVQKSRNREKIQRDMVIVFGCTGTAETHLHIISIKKQ